MAFASCFSPDLRPDFGAGSLSPTLVRLEASSLETVTSGEAKAPSTPSWLWPLGKFARDGDGFSPSSPSSPSKRTEETIKPKAWLLPLDAAALNEERLQDALSIMAAVCEAERLAESACLLDAQVSPWRSCNSWSVAESPPSSSAEKEGDRHTAGGLAAFAERHFDSDEGIAFWPGGDARAAAMAVAGVAVSVAGAAASMAEALMKAAAPANSCDSFDLEGLIVVEGDLSTDELFLRDTLRLALLRALQPLAQVENIALVAPCGSWRDPFREGLSNCSFEYGIHLADPNDLEPVREFLFLEAEAGGARRLLPLIAEQLFDDGRTMPRHLKVRFDIKGMLPAR